MEIKYRKSKIQAKRHGKKDEDTFVHLKTCD